MSKEYAYKFNESQPQEGICLKAAIDRVIDGDTVEATISFNVKIRLIGVNAPEKKQPGWVKFKDRLAALLCQPHKDVDEVVVFVPNNKPVTLLDVVTFDRILGEIWLDGKNLNAILESEIKEFKSTL